MTFRWDDPESQSAHIRSPDVRILHGDALEQLRTLADESVQCVVTSPPYYGLRDYGTAEWDGGDADCGHVQRDMRKAGMDGSTQNSQREGRAPPDDILYRINCGKCGATRIDAQIGLEPSPTDYIAKLVAVFREVRRVLRKDGVAWVNMGDSYADRRRWRGRNVAGGRQVRRDAGNCAAVSTRTACRWRLQSQKT